MKKKVLTVIFVILILLTIKILSNILINSILINNYNNGKYVDTQANSLTFLNFIQSYIARYNLGNINYQKGEYDKAIEEYEKALKGFVPKNKECSIRINYALAICKKVSVDESDQDSISNAIKEYEKAIDILTQKGCAGKEDNTGHNKKAEQLKKDIEQEIERLKNLQQSEENNTGDDENNEEENNEKKEEEIQEVEEKIQELKENATKEQRETESKYKNYNNYDFNRVQRNW